MPRDEHASSIYQRRSTSAVRGCARYAPYTADCAGLKAHASCPELYPSSSTAAPSPDIQSDPHCEISSAATLVNSSFDQEKFDSPCDSAFDKLSRGSEKKQKWTSLQQKKVDHFVLLIDAACAIMNELWPQSVIPDVFRLQSGATYGYDPQTRGRSVKDFPASQEPSDLVALRKFITELLKRSRSTAATFQTALCYLEAVRMNIVSLQQAEAEGKGTRGEPVDHAIGRVSIAPEFVAMAEEENRKLARNCNKSKLRKPHVESSFPLPDLPSPLLCPRRTLMGALVLAAKFVQDKCYSNRAWAKLCGLPPREVSRCERALGDALGWRLWVGREQLLSFGSLDISNKLERAPTAVLTGSFDDLKAASASNDKVTTLTRSATLPLPISRSVFIPAFLRPIDTDFAISPVPSLVTSSGSGSSNWPSGNLSPAPSPQPMFVSNETSTNALQKLRIANLIHTDTMICEPFAYGKHDGADFDMRIGAGQEVY